jgi:zinc transporter 1
VLSILLALIIVMATVRLLKQSCVILMQGVPAHVDVKKLESEIKQIDCVLSVHEFHVWNLNRQCTIASVHLFITTQQMDNEKLAGLILDVKNLLHKNSIHSTTIQLEFDHNRMDSFDLCDSVECGKTKCCPSKSNTIQMT